MLMRKATKVKMRKFLKNKFKMEISFNKQEVM